MQWNRSNVIGLAKASCSHCHGTGIRTSLHRAIESPCNCVFRAVFRACYSRFRECAVPSMTNSVSMEFNRGPAVARSFSRKREEYMADFCLIARRVLNDEEHTLFRYHFLLGADWRLCCRVLKVERGDFFHLIYRVQRKLGRAFAEVEPYALYPLREYFGGVVGPVAPTPIPITRRKPLKPWPLSA